MERYAFLDADEAEKYASAGLHYTRRVADAREDTRHRGYELDRLVKDTVSELGRSGQMRGWVIQARDGDGLSWAATDVATTLRAEVRDVDLREFAAWGPLSGEEPAIFAALDIKAVFRASVKSDYFRGVDRPRWWTRLPVLLGVGLVAVVAALLNAVVSKGSLASPVVIAAVFIAGLVPLLGKLFERHLGPTADVDQMREALLDAIADEERRGTHRTQFREFVRLLASQFAERRRPRAVIIDGYDRLDDLSRQVFERYLSEKLVRDSQPGWELWIVFERESAKHLWVRSKNAEDGSRLWFVHPYRLLELDPKQRADLADAVGHARRSTYLSVKDIAGADERWTEDVQGMLLRYVHAHPPGQPTTSPLDLLYLLAVAERTKGSPIIDRTSLGKVLSENRARTSALVQVLPGGKPERWEVDKLVRDLVADFPECVRQDEPGSTSTIRVLDAAAQVVVEKPEQFGLGPVGPVHTFWGLLWRDRFGDSPHPYAVRKAAAHLAAADLARKDETLRQLVFDALRQTAGECLRQAFVDDLVPVLDRAQAFASSEDDWRAIARLGWQAYALTGQPELLKMVLEIEPELIGRHGRRSDLTDPERAVAEIFMRSAIADNRIEPSDAVSFADDFFLDHGIARILWEQLTVLTTFPELTRRYVPEATDSARLLEALVARVNRRLDERLTRLAGTQEDDSKSRKQARAVRPSDVSLLVDLFTLSHCVSLTLIDLAPSVRFLSKLEADRAAASEAGAEIEADGSFQATRDTVWMRIDTVSDLLDSVALLVESLAEGRSLGATTDLVTAGAAAELAAVTRQAVALIGTVGLSDAAKSRLSDVEDMLEEAQPRPRHRGSAPDDSSTGLYVAHLTWGMLDFTDLAEMLALRAAQSDASFGVDYSNWTAPLELARERGGFPAFVSWAGTAPAQVSFENRATHTYYGLLALLATVRGPYRLHLALLALSVVSAYPRDRSDFFRALAEPGVDGDRALRDALAESSDELVEAIAVPLLNALHEASNVEVEPIQDALEARAASIEDPAVREEIETSLCAHKIVLRCQRGASIDVGAEVVAWPFDRSGGTYAYLLTGLMLASGGDGSAAVDEGIRLLRDEPQAWRGGNHGDVARVMAMSFLPRAEEATAGEFRLCLEVLAKQVEPPNDHLVISHALQDFKLLIANGYDTPEHRRDQEKFRLEAWRSDQIKIVEPLEDQGRYFEVFLHYARRLRELGLSWGSSDPLDEDESALADAWIKSDEPVVPKPLLRGGKVTLPNAYFLTLGDAIVESARVNPYDELLRGFRDQFDREARRSLQDLLRAAGGLDVGVGMKTLLEQFRARYDPLPLGANR